MRKTLTAAAALAPLWFAAGQAAAQTTVSGTTSTPVATATSGDITIDSGATINLTSPGAAVTINSNNTVSNTGTIQSSDINNATGILATGGFTGSVDNTGTIDLKDSKGPSTDGTTGVTQSPVAPDVNGVAPTARIGILEQGAAPFVGNIINDTDGVINVTGDQSYGIAIQGTVTGNVSNIGSITITGDNSVGLSVSGAVAGASPVYSSAAGNVLVTGTITATGQNTSAIVLSGDVSGRFSVYSAITASGYGSNSRSLSNQLQADIQNAPTEVEKGGAAVVVGGNVGQGVYVGAIPINTVSGGSSTADNDGDGITDTSETTASITAYGNQPAMVIGAAGKNIAVGQLQLTSTLYNQNLQGYGVVIAGTLAGNGLEDGVAATGLQIGAAPVGYDVANGTNDLTGDAAAIGAVATGQGAGLSGGGTVNIAGGIQITGSVTATAYGADSIGMHVLSGSTIPVISVVGALSATTDQPLPNASTGNPTPYTASAYGLVIEAGANVNSLAVTGALSATVNGDGGVNAGYTNNAAAVIDYSGSLSNVTVTGSITAALTPTETTITPIGSTTALDLRYNTSGVNLTMNQAPETISTAVTASGTTTTETTTGPAPSAPNYTGAAIVTTVTSGDTTTTTTTPVAPTITGDVYLGSGTNTVTINAGTLTGMLQVGSGSAATTTDIDMENSSIFNGKLVALGNATFAFNINSGTFTDTYAQALTVSSLHIGANGVFSFAIDPLHNAYTSLNVTGAAVLDNGAKLGVNVLSNINGTQTFALINATGGLSVAGATSTLAPDVPYLFTATTAISGNTLDLTIREKTPSELGMTQAEGAALPAIYAALPSNTAIQGAIFDQYQRGTFIKLYDQLMPDYAGGLFQASAEASRTISRLTADPNQIENPTGSRGAWAQQFFVGAYQGRGDTVPFQAGGFGYAGGVETGGLGFGAVGATAAFVAINEDDPQSPTDSRIGMSELEGGLYWQGELGGLTLDARVGASYNWFAGRRQFVYFNTTTNTTTYTTQANGSWTGYSLTGHFGAAYEIDLGSVWFLRPQAQIDYFRLDQGSYTERNGAAGFNLAIDEVTGDEGSASAAMVLGAKFGRTVVWRPEFQLGVRDVFFGTPGDVTGHFVGGTIPFTLDPAAITGPAGVARIKFKGSSEYYEVGIEGGVEARSRYSEGDAKLSVRVLF